MFSPISDDSRIVEVQGKVDVSIETTKHRFALCESQLVEIQKVKELICLNLREATSRALSSSELRKLVLGALIELKWATSALVTPNVSQGNPVATLRVSGLLDLRSCTCEKVHRILINCMFDNRQALGTNLLKFQVGSSYYQSEYQDVTSIGICVSESAKNKNEWDSSIGIFDEYSGSLLMQYKNVITANIILWEVNF